LIIVRHKEDTHEFETLTQAIAWATELGEFVKIEFGGIELVGVFGADGITDGKCPDGVEYTWMKRRKS
jgi:hypothetical protein